MKTLMKIIILFVSFAFLFGCNQKIQLEKLQGKWSKKTLSKKELYKIYYDIDLDSILETEINYIEPLTFYKPYGFAFTKEKFEVFNGFSQFVKDSITQKNEFKYLGNFTDYQIQNDSVFILEPLSKEWTFLWKILKLDNKKLVVQINDSIVKKYYRIKEPKSLDLDQILYSSSGCYGTCPIIDVSINKKGELIFQGEKFVNLIGFFEKKIDSSTTNYIFDKYNHIELSKISDNYDVGHTDDEIITTTLIKNGKIIKTVHDYGRIAPKKLFWAYNRLSNIHREYKLDTLKNAPFYPKLHYFAFVKDSMILRLEKSESFYFWTELLKSDISSIKHETIYKIFFRGNFTFFSNNMNDIAKKQYIINEIRTDGRIYTFFYDNGEKITYDLGYNFIKRNFDEDDFKQMNEWELKQTVGNKSYKQ